MCSLRAVGLLCAAAHSARAWPDGAGSCVSTGHDVADRTGSGSFAIAHDAAAGTISLSSSGRFRGYLLRVSAGCGHFDALPSSSHYIPCDGESDTAVTHSYEQSYDTVTLELVIQEPGSAVSIEVIGVVDYDHSNRWTFTTAGSAPASCARTYAAPAAQGHVSENDPSVVEERPSTAFYVAHGATMMAAVYLCAFPGAVVARVSRGLLTAAGVPDGQQRAWFVAHRALSSASALLLVLGFFFAVVAADKDGGAHFDNRHGKLGMATLALVPVQIGLGLARAHPWHRLCGIVLLVLLLVQMAGGMAQPGVSGTSVADDAPLGKAAAVVGPLLLALYALGVVALSVRKDALVFPLSKWAAWRLPEEKNDTDTTPLGPDTRLPQRAVELTSPSWGSAA